MADEAMWTTSLTASTTRPIWAPRGVRDHDPAEAGRRRLGQAESLAQVHHRNDPPAQVDDAAERSIGAGQGRDRRQSNDLVDPTDLDAVALAGDDADDELDVDVGWRLGMASMPWWAGPGIRRSSDRAPDGGVSLGIHD